MEKKKGKEKISLSELKKKFEECEKSKEEYLAGWQRARADFLNYKKEERERVSEFLKYRKEELILKLLPVLDSFERASTLVLEDKHQEVFQGFLQIKEQLEDFLKDLGVEEIEAKGKKFDPNFHEAVEQVEPSFAKASEGKEIEPGTIIEVLEKGYTLHNKVIRPVKVKVGK